MSVTQLELGSLWNFEDCFVPNYKYISNKKKSASVGKILIEGGLYWKSHHVPLKIPCDFYELINTYAIPKKWNEAKKRTIKMCVRFWTRLKVPFQKSSRYSQNKCSYFSNPTVSWVKSMTLVSFWSLKHQLLVLKLIN